MPKARRAGPGTSYEQRTLRALQRRFNSYPGALHEILGAAIAGKNASATFTQHNDVNAFLMRWYRFRLDALELHVPGSLRLRDVKARAVNADGTCYNSRNKLDPGPYTIHWEWQGGPIEALSEEQQEADARFAADMAQERREIGGVGWINKQTGPLVGKDESAGGKATEDWFKGKHAAPPQAEIPKVDTSGLNIPALDEHSTTGEPIPPCPPHEPDLSDSYCIKCTQPKEKW